MVRKEPTEGAATKIPKPCGPTFKMSSAKTANNAIAPPNKTENMSKVSAPKIAFVLKTKRTPSFKLSNTGSPILGFKTGFLLILNSTKNEKVTKKKIMLKDQCTPIQLIENPAKATPKTRAICHKELFQVAAFGYIFLGTINATKEKIMGPKNALKKPPKKTKAYIKYNSVCVESALLTASDVIQKRPKLIKEKAAIHKANRFIFSF